MISRRHYIAGGWALFASVAVGSVVRPFSDVEAVAGPLDEHFRYRGRRVDVDRHGREAHVRVDVTRQVHVHRGGPGNGFMTHALPFTEFTSPQLLARAVIDAEDAGLLLV